MTTSTVIERLRLSARVYNALVRAGIDTVEQLAAIEKPQEIKGVWRTGAKQIREALRHYPRAA